eukprot:TRINITY_DN3503_c0_g1_i5.p1 TRINITY_DN3503_c0_g1~~TRINITY_DN3503_c0_g1_i5.p1  ORF type:complete len:393 (-),score=117.53 TRINITY_DN3503_c0_g1_i5:51-1229(-)
MGCMQSTPATQQDVKSAEDTNLSNSVEMQLILDRIRELFRFKVLILGAGESGKSTIVKVLKLIYHRGKEMMSPEEKERAISTLHENVHQCIKALLDASEKLNVPISDEEDRKTSDYLRDLNPGSDRFRIDPDLGQRILHFWLSQEVQHIYSRRAEYWILDACGYYMANLERFCSEDFEPTEEDMLMARIRTTGIVVNEFDIKRPDPEPDEPDCISFQVVDVGGQRNERRKWINCFDDVKAIIFTVSLAGYNQVLFEDHSKKRITEDLELFDTITKRPQFRDTPVFLWFNKKDLFEKMILTDDLAIVYPEYKGGKSLIPALEFVTALFKARAPQGKLIEHQYVSARVKKDIKEAFQQVTENLYKHNVKLIEQEKSKLKKHMKSVRPAVKPNFA